MTMKLGMIYVFTGDGKGKTSAAVGTAVRAVSVGMKVAWVAWYKQESWKIAEIEAMKRMGIETYLFGKGFHISESENQRIRESEIKTRDIAAGAKVVDTASENEHRLAAEAALQKANELIGKVDLLVLDEVNNAVQDELINVEEVLKVVKVRKGTHVVLTGRDVHLKLAAKADLVTEMKKIKHPYDEGKLAVRGLDF